MREFERNASLHLAPLAGRGRERSERVRGYRTHDFFRIFGSKSPSPRPSKGELRSSRPRKSGARERIEILS